MSKIKSYFFFFILFGSCSSAIAEFADKPPGFAVATANPLATKAGLDILEKGGNAFDAAVAVSAVLAVVEPYHSGLGGGGFWLLHLENEKKNVFIDGREAAPLAAHKTMFLDKAGNRIPGLSINGGLAAAIPGEPASLVYIANRYGHLPLAQTLEPAIQLAEKGFIVNHEWTAYFQLSDYFKTLQQFPDTAAVFLNNGKPYQRGACFKQPDLAKTLRRLAEKGHEGFYQGEIAEHLVKGVRAAGGIWTLADLKNYQIKVREPLQGAFHNLLIITAPPPSAGGVALLTMLNILSGIPLESLSKIQWTHYVIESMRLAFWQRAQYLGDPDFISLPLNFLISMGNAKKLRELIPADKAGSSKSIQFPLKENEKTNTTHLAILDKEGNRVSATLTINNLFGSSVVPAGTGVLLNDEMDDFSTGEKNRYGITPSLSNEIAPGKRPVSSMTPTFLEMPGRMAIVGTPGGPRIPTMILLATLDFFNYGGAITMVSSMRFHHQYLPDQLEFEPETFSPNLQAQLSKMGYTLKLINRYYGDMQAITWDKTINFITAASDPRHVGLAATIKAN